jgi:hypothetical protein
MHIFNLVFGIVLLFLGITSIWSAAREWPQNTSWPFLANGKYTTTIKSTESKIIITDVYGKIVAEAEMKPKIN